jgi:hypothetical protein
MVQIPTDSITLNKEPNIKGFQKEQTFNIVHNSKEYTFFTKENAFKKEWCDAINLVISKKDKKKNKN